MKKIQPFKKLILALVTLALFGAATVAAASILPVSQGGTGTNTLTGIVQGNGTVPLSPISVGTGLDFTSGVLSATGLAGVVPNEVQYGGAFGSLAGNGNFIYGPSGSVFDVGFSGTNFLHVRGSTFPQFRIGDSAGTNISGDDSSLGISLNAINGVTVSSLAGASSVVTGDSAGLLGAFNLHKNSVLWSDGSQALQQGDLHYDGNNFFVGPTGNEASLSVDPTVDAASLGRTMSHNQISVTADDANKLVTIHAFATTVQGIVDSSGVTGLDDMGTPTGTFTGYSTTTATLTMQDTDCTTIDYNSLTGGTFGISDSITDSTSGATGFVRVDDGSGEMQACETSGTFSPADNFDNGGGVSAVVTTATPLFDAFSISDGVVTVSNIGITGASQPIGDGVFTSFTSLTGHTIGDVWTWTYTITNGNLAKFDGNNSRVSIGDADGISTNTKLLVDVPRSQSYFINKFGGSHGANMASTANLGLNDDGNYFKITGAATMNCIKNGTWRDGMRVVFYFTGSATLTHGATCGVGASPYALAGSANATTVAGARYEFILDTSLGQWVEISRTYP